VDHYIVYRSIRPDELGDSLALTAEASFVDSGAVGNESVHYYYMVKTIDGVGNKSEASNRVGEFDRGLVSVK
jgi:fibronectin type 3 domain-containing protein